MPPKWAKNSEPEDKQILCRLDAKQKISASTPRIKRKLVLQCLTQHFIMGKIHRSPKSQKSILDSLKYA